MRTWIIIAVLAVPVGGWAEEMPTSVVSVMTTGQSGYTCKMDQWAKEMPVCDKRLYCLQQAEAVMRGLDSALDPHDIISEQTTWLSIITRKQWEQWQAVKDECFK